MSFDVLIDENAARVVKHGVRYIERQIADTLNGRVRNLSFLPLDEFATAIQACRNSGSDLLIGGGDEAVVCAARISQTLGIGGGKPFGILPLGHENVIAADLHIAQDFTTALTQYWQCKRKNIDVGMVNGRLFLREAVVDPDLMNLDRISIRSDVRSHDSFPVDKIVIGNNAFVGRPVQHLDDVFKKRRSVTCGKLSVYIAKRKTVLDKCRAALNPFRTGRESFFKKDRVEFFETENIDIDIPHKKVPLVIDGEPVSLRSANRLQFQIFPKALPVIVPAVSGQ